MITGITGFLGSLAAKKILQSKEFQKGAIKIVGITRDAAKTKSVFQGVKNSGIIIAETDIRDKQNLFSVIETPIDYIIHCASVTQSTEMVKHPVEVADTIIAGTRHMLELSRKRRVKGMVYLSTMEVYGKVDNRERKREEGELGDIDLFSSRSCYPLGKRMAEHYCYLYQREYGVPVKIARLAQIFGRGARPDDQRVYMQFARAICEKKDIVLKTPGNSMGNYCASDDAVNAIFTILFNGRDGEAYNVVNESNTMSIREMAELAADQIAGGQIAVTVELEDSCITGYAPDTGLRLSGEKLRQLGWQPKKQLPEMYREVIEELSLF